MITKTHFTAMEVICQIFTHCSTTKENKAFIESELKICYKPILCF